MVSAVSMALGVPVMIVALFSKGPAMLPAIAVAAFLLFLNTSPLNAALINSVGAHIRATAIAVNIFIIHLLGDVPSPTLMGYIADKRSLQTAFIGPVVAMVLSSAILFYGMRFAPAVARTKTDSRVRRKRPRDELFPLDCRMRPGPGLVLASGGRGGRRAEDRRHLRSGVGPQTARQSARQHYRSRMQRSR